MSREDVLPGKTEQEESSDDLLSLIEVRVPYTYFQAASLLTIFSNGHVVAQNIFFDLTVFYMTIQLLIFPHCDIVTEREVNCARGPTACMALRNEESK